MTFGGTSDYFYGASGYLVGRTGKLRWEAGRGCPVWSECSGGEQSSASLDAALAVAPFPFSKSSVQNGPELSRARRFCAAKRTLDGEDRSGRWD